MQRASLIGNFKNENSLKEALRGTDIDFH